LKGGVGLEVQGRVRILLKGCGDSEKKKSDGVSLLLSVGWVSGGSVVLKRLTLKFTRWARTNGAIVKGGLEMPDGIFSRGGKGAGGAICPSQTDS